MSTQVSRPLQPTDASSLSQQPELRFGGVEVENVTQGCHAQNAVTTHTRFRFMDLPGGKKARLDPFLPLLTDRKSSVIVYTTLPQRTGRIAGESFSTIGPLSTPALVSTMPHLSFTNGHILD